jgi:hypothetical protein
MVDHVHSSAGVDRAVAEGLTVPLALGCDDRPSLPSSLAGLIVELGTSLNWGVVLHHGQPVLCWGGAMDLEESWRRCISSGRSGCGSMVAP